MSPSHSISILRGCELHRNLLNPFHSSFGDYLLTNQIGQGTFSRVFIATFLPDHDGARRVAVKLETGEADLDMMSNEAMILRNMNRDGPSPHFAKIIHFYRSETCRFIIMTLFGETLAQLKEKSMDRRFTVGTWSRIGLQVLYGLKLLHDKGFIHRDLKPDNLMIGTPNDPSRCRTVQIIDFGSSRQFAVRQRTEKGFVWMARPLRRRVEFVGNVKFVAPSMHFGKDQGRKDDLWSLIYTLVDLNGELPWEEDTDEQDILAKKMNPSTYLAGMPEEMEQLVEHLQTLDAFQRPCYE